MSGTRRASKFSSGHIMDPFAEERSADPHKDSSPEDLLVSLERFADAVLLKAEISSHEAKERYEKELLPRLEHVRRLVAQKSPMAGNAVQDTMVLFREYLLTTGAPVVAEPIDPM